tara:strand:- start:265 stop:789 length:525 start_codon:yes stop_codon:yes gene_type:complete
VKYIKNFLFVLFFLSYSNYCLSQNIVYANFDLVVKNSNVGKKIINHYTKINDELVEQLKKQEKKIQNDEQLLISQKNVLEAEEFESKVKILQKEIIEFNRNQNDELSKIKFERDEVLKSFQKEINSILKEFAENNNIDIILSSNQMLIGKSNLDVTNEIIKIINNKIKNFEIKK